MSILIHEQSGRRTIYYPDDRRLRQYTEFRPDFNQHGYARSQTGRSRPRLNPKHAQSAAGRANYSPASRGKISTVAKWSDEETDEPLIADHRNFYKVEKWTKDEQRIERIFRRRPPLQTAGAALVGW